MKRLLRMRQHANSTSIPDAAPHAMKRVQAPTAMYQYAVQEYNQTIAPNSQSHSDDGGMKPAYQQQQPQYYPSYQSGHQSSYSNNNNNNNNNDEYEPPLPMAESSARRKTATATTTPDPEMGRLSSQPSVSAATLGTNNNNAAVVEDTAGKSSIFRSTQMPDGREVVGSSSSAAAAMEAMTASHRGAAAAAYVESRTNHHHRSASPVSSVGTISGVSSSFNGSFSIPGYVPEESSRMPKMRSQDVDNINDDSAYEEIYGNAYVGTPMRYVYPSGYQSMRPRSGPWKLSMAVCALFTWLSVFIVGHCSDRAAAAQLILNEEKDDDLYVYETRWCGSRALYLMWVLSMLVTGLATAYCGIIGYIKVRDFSVANCRSQPPGTVGKSDYYFKIDDSNRTGMDEAPNIYQSDGNPQFWGSHIYRPTQAAVAVTSR